jgi:hypothetical protein
MTSAHGFKYVCERLQDALVKTPRSMIGCEECMAGLWVPSQLMLYFYSLASQNRAVYDMRLTVTHLRGLPCHFIAAYFSFLLSLLMM